ncbi:uncharacterized protein FIBRA_02207 [Fibroporia radiculosa]|uniref:Btz domain-containing protein n=1 Tax=Fibroporia radiculosa TaxID=599839 RepID=J4H1Q4_9APHY|nr:uncharacterized protein FIBRA_02207 [Fibroporia radiculosa]CCM00179.1 predicted protein [Fibroporia radiculosa]
MYNVPLSILWPSNVWKFFRELYPSKPQWSADDIPDMTGKVVIVTGANAGLGLESVVALAARGAKVYATARSQEKGATALNRINARLSNMSQSTRGEVHFLCLELNDLNSVKAAVEEFLSKESRLHILLNNAGIMLPKEDKPINGIDLQFATNVLGPFAFTRLLLPTLLLTAKQSEEGTVRIVHLASIAHMAAPPGGIRFDAMSEGKIFHRYAQSKMGNIVFANEVARRYTDSGEYLNIAFKGGTRLIGAYQGLISVSISPGNVSTNLWRHQTSFFTWNTAVSKHPPAKGVLTQLYAATSPEVTREDAGIYFAPFGKRSTPFRTEVDDPALGMALWDWCEGQMKKQAHSPPVYSPLAFSSYPAHSIMVAPASSIVSKSTNTVGKSLSNSHARKTRPARRRGRAALGVESDEEIEREVTSDDNSDDDRSSVESESESESESFSDDARVNGRSEVVTPSTTQSPPPQINGHVPLKNGMQSKPINSGPFAAATDWADMVTAEHANGAEELPVIDFADLDQHGIDQPIIAGPHLRKTHRQGKRSLANRSSSAPPTSPPQRDDGLVDAHEDGEPEPVASTSDHLGGVHLSSRVRSQSARQAYQQRLETDPSFVPKVGEFWGHDDRLLDKDLRSLSGWWRGRWQTRGRGRGAFVMRGRASRGFYGGRAGPYGPIKSGDDEVDLSIPDAEIPPVEKTWTHDGFEEMKRRDEKRREVLQQRAQEQDGSQQHVRFGPQRGFAPRGRGGFFVPRGRGGFVRGGSPIGARASPIAHAAAGRPWFAMKPERMWTKQHEGFLYFDPALKPRPGQGPGFRVKLPGSGDHIIRGPPRSYPPSKVAFPVAGGGSQDGSGGHFVVRIPRPGKEKVSEDSNEIYPQNSLEAEPATTMAELSIEEVFTVRPNLVPNRRVDIPMLMPPPIVNVVSHAESSGVPSSPASIPMSQASTPTSSLRKAESNSRQHQRDQMELESPLVQPTSSSPSALLKETVLRRPSLSAEVPTSPVVPTEESSRPPPPTLPPLQTSFSPVPQTSPPYGSPYAFGPPVPPNMGMHQHGMSYELAAGRPYYFHQQTPPPMFTPRPMMHPHVHHHTVNAPYIPPHMFPHSTASQDFLPHSHTPPLGSFYDPTTGAPIFAPARQSSRIEIRAPTEVGESKKSTSRPSGLRVSMSSTESYPAPEDQQPSLEVSQDSEEATATSEAPLSEQPQTQVLEAPMPYPPYQQQYFYPETYAYQPYMDMSPQVMHYEMYSADHRPAPPPMIFY